MFVGGCCTEISGYITKRLPQGPPTAANKGVYMNSSSAGQPPALQGALHRSGDADSRPAAAGCGRGWGLGNSSYVRGGNRRGVTWAGLQGKTGSDRREERRILTTEAGLAMLICCGGRFVYDSGLLLRIVFACGLGSTLRCEGLRGTAQRGTGGVFWRKRRRCYLWQHEGCEGSILARGELCCGSVKA